MIRGFADSSHLTEIPAPEAFRGPEVERAKEIPSLSELSEKLKDIFENK